MEPLTLSEADVSGIEQISRLAEVIWNQHYTSIISVDQIRYMLHKMYSRDSLEDQMLKKHHRFFIIHHQQEAIGFVSVNEESRDTWFLNKFYILQDLAGKGFGSKVFDELCGLLKPKQITLTVNRQNYKSINFYFKKGFTIQKVADFDIGNGYVMNDFVMTWLAKK